MRHYQLRKGARETFVLLTLSTLGSWSLPQSITYNPVVFKEEAAKREVRFMADPSRTAHKHQPETMVSGVALFDYDNDGWLDIYAVNGATMPGLEKKHPEFSNRLFRNDGDGTFTDVTMAAGVAGKSYEHGVATGDSDNDGDVDLFIAGLRANILYRNNGDGTFSDATEAAGLGKSDPEYGTLWGVAAAFADYDNDGRLDLFVSNYCVWDPKTEPWCGDRNAPDYCHPRYYHGLPNSLFHNNGDGTFTDVSVASGIRKHIGKGMGIGVADFDDDGYVDFFLANDTLPGFLFMNNRDGTFAEVGFERGVAYTDRAQPISGMGADARDIDNDGLPDIFETALSTENFPLFRNLGGASFEDVTARSGLGVLARTRAGWSNGIADFNSDGHKDLFVASADVMDPGGHFREKVPLANSLFINLGNGRFVDGNPTAGPDFARRAVHRGSALGDIDNDGRIDAVVTALEAPLELWHNVSPEPAHWLLVSTIGSKSNRDGQGARIKIVTESGARYNHVHTAVGYGCSSDPRVHFGLGSNTIISEMTVNWPSGVVQIFKKVAIDQILTIRKP
jgi:hypothetical protein